MQALALKPMRRRGRDKQLLVVGLLLIAVAELQAQETQKLAAECEHPADLLAGMRAARQELVSGTYSATGHSVRHDVQFGAVEGEVTVFSAFDYRNGLMRFDRREPRLFRDPPSNEPDVRLIEVKLARSPKQLVVWDQSAGQDRMHHLSIHKPEFGLPEFGQPFDVRTFGLMGWSSIDGGVSLERALELFESHPVVETRTVEQANHGSQCIVTFQHGPHDDIKTTLWIDPTRGFTVTRSELRALNRRTNQWSDVVALAEVEWTRISEVWVPRSLVLQRNFHGEETYSLSLDWESVNGSVPPKLFEPDGLGLEPETLVVDRRLGDRPVTIGNLRDFGKGSHASRLPPVDNHRSSRFLFLLVANGLILLLLVSVFLWKRRKRLKG